MVDLVGACSSKSTQYQNHPKSIGLCAFDQSVSALLVSTAITPLAAFAGGHQRHFLLLGNGMPALHLVFCFCKAAC